MALQLNFTACVVNGCSQIRFTETTGVYSTSNTTGYGTPNSDTGTATTAVLTITSPSNDVYTIDLFATGNFPSSNNTYYYDIPTASLGDLTNIVDGKWTITYTSINDSVTYTKTKYVLFHCNAECCVTEMLIDLDTDCDCCTTKSKSNLNYIKTSVTLQSLKYAAKCGSIELFNKLLATI